MKRQQFIRRVLKPIVFTLSLLPLLWLVYGWGLALMGLQHPLGFNPIEYTNRFLGDWALRFLLISLAMTPLKILTGSAIPIQFRRMLGLFAFTYVFIHMFNYVAVDRVLDLAVIWEDVLKRIYMTLGMTAFLLLIPLAITSTKGWIKRIGGKAWVRLHKLVYPAAVLACFHFIYMAKGDQLEPKIYLAILVFLLGVRLMPLIRKKVTA